MIARSLPFAILTISVCLLTAEAAWAWGPLTHVRLAEQVLSQLWLLPAGVAALLARHAREYIFGNIAADVVFAKKLSRIKQICHQWSTGFSLLERAESDAGRVFAYGYLSHLAADTIAHNKFLPLQILSSGTTVTFGHLYWELRADSTLPSDYWFDLRRSLHQRHDEAHDLLADHLTRTLLPYGVNRRIFQRINLLASARQWHQTMRLWSRLSRWPLDTETLADFHAESIERIVSVLERGPSSAVLYDDPNGNSTLAHARRQKRLLRQLRRARLPLAGIVSETVRNHVPRPRGSLSLAVVPPARPEKFSGNIVS